MSTLKWLSPAVLLLCCSSTHAFRIPAFLRSLAGDSWSKPTPTPQPARSIESLLIPPSMMQLSKWTKGLPMEYTPVPVIVGTKAELLELKKVLGEMKVLPENSMELDTDAPDNQVLSVPLASGDIMPRMPEEDQTPAQDMLKNLTCETSIEEMLPLLRSHPLPTLVHDNPELILSMVQSLVPKPETFEAQADVELLPSTKKLISLAVRNPDWVRALITAEPTILNDMLGLSSIEATTETPTNSTA